MNNIAAQILKFVMDGCPKTMSEITLKMKNSDTYLTSMSLIMSKKPHIYRITRIILNKK